MGRLSNQVPKLLLLFAAHFCNGVVSLDILPDCMIGVDNVEYYIFNRDNRDGVVVDQNATDIPIKNDTMTFVIAHGFISEANATQYQNLSDTLVDKYDVNVISVDWKEGACTAGGMTLTKLLGYPTAVGNTQEVGEDISRIISRLIDDHGIDLEDIYLIGHSLGAHVVGFAGKDLQKQGTGTVHHIVALDPAGPGFETSECDERVCSSDAEFVQVFHTSFTLGMHKAIGDIDFYFNGGTMQPGCTLLNDVVCSHSSAVEYLMDILQNPDCKFIGEAWDRMDLFPPDHSCTEDTCSIPGLLAAELPARGTFYVDTENLPSYCTGKS